MLISPNWTVTATFCKLPNALFCMVVFSVCLVSRGSCPLTLSSLMTQNPSKRLIKVIDHPKTWRDKSCPIIKLASTNCLKIQMLSLIMDFQVVSSHLELMPKSTRSKTYHSMPTQVTITPTRPLRVSFLWTNVRPNLIFVTSMSLTSRTSRLFWSQLSKSFTARHSWPCIQHSAVKFTWRCHWCKSAKICSSKSSSSTPSVMVKRPKRWTFYKRVRCSRSLQDLASPIGKSCTPKQTSINSLQSS